MHFTTEKTLAALLSADEQVQPDQIEQVLAVLKGSKKEGAEPSRLLTMKEVADRFGCTIRTVQRWCRDGELPVIRRGRLVRVPEEALYSLKVK